MTDYPSVTVKRTGSTYTIEVRKSEYHHAKFQLKQNEVEPVIAALEEIQQ